MALTDIAPPEQTLLVPCQGIIGINLSVVDKARKVAMPTKRFGELQTLRAIAVIAVIAYHFKIPSFTGGFVGVDIFFVLSGFFITRILVRDIELYGQIRFARFFASRAKRLLPNALLVITSVLIVSILLLPSHRSANVSQDALFASTFLANFHFAAEAVDYFRLDDPASPLLHYWSLAVEEQFYFCLPLALTLALAAPKAKPKIIIISILILIVVTSFIASVIEVEQSQPKAFFYPQYRAWQLALGGLTGLAFDHRQAILRPLRFAGGMLGACIVFVSIFALRDDMTYPGMWALIPTVGTALLILGFDANKLLSGALHFRPMTLVGDMSYSLYLWHWPVATFLTYLAPQLDLPIVIMGLMLTITLGWGAWKLVERPIHKMELSSPTSFHMLCTGIIASGIVASASLWSTSISGNSNPRLAELIATASSDLGENYVNGCHLRYEQINHPTCRFGNPSGPRVVLFGDSHAAQWFEPLSKAVQNSKWELEAWTKTSCPSYDVTIWYRPARSTYDECTKWRNSRLKELLSNPPQLVILANSSHYFTWLYDATRSAPADRSTASDLWRYGGRKVIEQLIAAGIHVVEVRDTPRMYASYKDCLSVGKWEACSRPRGEALSGLPPAKFSSDLFKVLDLNDKLCTDHACPSVFNNIIAYRDSHHLTASYASTFSKYFEHLLNALPRK